MNKKSALLPLVGLAATLTLVVAIPHVMADAVSWEKISNQAKQALEGKDSARAIDLYTKAVEEARGSKLEAKFIALSLNDLAMAYNASGNKAEAEKYLKEALSVKEAAYGAEDASLVPTLGNLGQLYKANKEFNNAAAAYQRAVDITQKLSEGRSVKLIPLVNAQAALSTEMGDDAAALEKLKQVVDLCKESKDKGAQVIAMNNMAVVLRKQGKTAEAEAIYKDVVALQGTTDGDGGANRAEDKDKNNAAALTNLARVMREKGDFAGAKPLLEKAFEQLSANASAENLRDRIVTADNLATVSKELGDFEEAAKYYRTALDLQNQVKDTPVDLKATRLTNLALTLVAVREVAEREKKPFDATEIEKLFKESISILEAQYGADSDKVAPALNNLAEYYRLNEDYAGAEPLLRRSYDLNKKALGDSSPKVADSANDLAILYKEMGKEKESRDMYAASLAVREKSPADSADLATALSNMARSYRQDGDYAKSEELYKRALSMREKVFGPQSPEVAAVLRNYSVLLKAMGRKPEAKELDKRANAIEATE